MPQLSKINGVHQASKAVVLFGLNDDGRPRAGLFAGKQTALATKAAKKLGLTALSVSDKQLADLGKIPPGRLYANRRSLIPNIRRDVHVKLIELAKKSGTAVKSTAAPKGDQASPPDAGFPKDWDSIGPGHQVIAQSSVIEGWWEAIVLERDGEMLTLFWRDYPKESHFKQHFEMVAIQLAARAKP